VIHEVDEVIQTLMRDARVGGSGVEVAFDAARAPLSTSTSTTFARSSPVGSWDATLNEMKTVT
jgi:hypothetical protein